LIPISPPLGGGEHSIDLNILSRLRRSKATAPGVRLRRRLWINARKKMKRRIHCR